MTPESPMDRLARLGALRTAERVCQSRGVRLEDVLGRARHPILIAARHDLWSLLRWSTGLSLSDIGRIFGVHHSTVHTAVQHREAQLMREYY